jgi:HK97 family phage major capsid protein
MLLGGGGYLGTAFAGDISTYRTTSFQTSARVRFQPNAQWCANLSTINALRQFETGNGALKFPALQDSPPVLLGRAVHEPSNMDGIINAAATENNYLLIYGDFAAGMVIVDRVGSTIELVPHLVGPSGARPGSGVRCCGFAPAQMWSFRTRSGCCPSRRPPNVTAAADHKTAPA